MSITLTDIPASVADYVTTQVIDDGKNRGEMFVRLEFETTLDAGQVGTPIQIVVHAIDQGEASITAHVHANVDQDQLFPTSLNKNDRQKVQVV